MIDEKERISLYSAYEGTEVESIRTVCRAPETQNSVDQKVRAGGRHGFVGGGFAESAEMGL